MVVMANTPHGVIDLPLGQRLTGINAALALPRTLWPVSLSKQELFWFSSRLRYRENSSALTVADMAPSATETVTVTQPPLKLHSTTSGTGDYKQLQAHSVDREAEEGRKAGIKGAKVRVTIRPSVPLSLF